MTKAEQMVRLVEILPDQDQDMLLELARKFIRAWDPDFTKLTPKEAEELQAAKLEETMTHEQVLKELGL